MDWRKILVVITIFLVVAVVVGIVVKIVVVPKYDPRPDIAICQEEIKTLQEKDSKQGDVRKTVEMLIQEINASNIEMADIKNRVLGEIDSIRKDLGERIEDVNIKCRVVSPGHKTPSGQSSERWDVSLVLCILTLLVAILSLSAQFSTERRQLEYFTKGTSGAIEWLVRNIRRERIEASDNEQKRDEIAQEFAGDIAIRIARMKVIGGDARDVSTGADYLSFRGNPDIDLPLLREASKRRDLPKEMRENLKRAIRDLEKQRG